MSTRARAAKCLAPVIQQKASLSTQLDTALAALDAEDRPFFQELCLGVLRHYFELDAIAQALLSKPLKAKDSDIYAALLIGLYQLRHMRVPDHAAISETVNAAKKLKKVWASKLLNGVLRNYRREEETLLASLQDNASYTSAHPWWLLKKVRKAWPESWQDILAANNQRPPLTLRVNASKSSRDQYIEALKQKNIDVEATDFADHGLRLTQSQDVTKLPFFSEGWVSVQDEAAQLSASLLDLKPGQRVLDACCAPGGKTCHILESEPQLAKVVAVELEASRLERVRENLTRLQLSAELHAADASEPDLWWDKKPFDRILLDAPCSATGVIRRHPDIKLLRRESDIDNLAELQLKLLKQLWPLLKDKGILVYATCSILPQENEDILAKFVEIQKDAIHLPIESPWGHSRDFGKQLFPQAKGHDGFYYARLTKKSAED